MVWVSTSHRVTSMRAKTRAYDARTSTKARLCGRAQPAGGGHPATSAATPGEEQLVRTLSADEIGEVAEQRQRCSARMATKARQSSTAPIVSNSAKGPSTMTAITQ